MPWRLTLALALPCSCRALWSENMVTTGEQLPSFKAGPNGTKMVRDVKWWAHVGEHVFVAPHPDGTLSQHIGDYYAAMGSDTALTDTMRQRRVGGQGRWHIFHLPQGPATLQFNRRGDRRSAFSSLVQLRAGDVFPATFPKYDPAECQGSEDERYDAMEKSAVESISASSFLEYLQRIVDIKDDLGVITRSYSNKAGSNAAQAFLMAEFESMGLTSCLQKFTYQSVTPMANVVAVIPGTGEGTLTVGAHYDSRPFKGKAPGAEDNGSGLAAMLSVARAFAKQGVKPTRTIYFVGFAGEEPGLVGSDVFARELKSGSPLPKACGAAAPRSSFLQTQQRMQRGDSGHEAIALDEVGWLTPKYDKATINLESYDWTPDMMDHLACSSRRHNGDGLQVVHSSNPFGSDHMSFLERGMKAVLVINGDDEAYPNYHMSTDTIDNVNSEYAAKVTKMVMGAVMRLARQSS